MDKRDMDSLIQRFLLWPRPMDVERVVDPWPEPDIDMGRLLNQCGPACDIEMNNFGVINFETGQARYSTDSADGLITVQVPQPRIIGTTGLAVCTGIMIVTKQRAVVAHFSPSATGDPDDEVFDDGIGGRFYQFLLDNIASLREGQVWIMHTSAELSGHQPAQGPPDTVSVLPWGARGTLVGEDLISLGKFLTRRMGYPVAQIKFLMYKPVLDHNAPATTKGEETILVDGRFSPAQFPKIYAHGFRQN